MKVKVSGIVMEILDEYDEKKRLLGTKTIVMFQKGYKGVISVKKTPEGEFTEGQKIEDLLVKAVAWTMDGKTANLSLSYVVNTASHLTASGE